jgi:hypothetical protein
VRGRGDLGSGPFSASSCLASRELGYSPRVPKEKELNSSSKEPNSPEKDNVGLDDGLSAPLAPPFSTWTPFFILLSCLASRELGYSPRVPKEKELNSSSFLRFHLVPSERSAHHDQQVDLFAIFDQAVIKLVRERFAVAVSFRLPRLEGAWLFTPCTEREGAKLEFLPSLSPRPLTSNSRGEKCPSRSASRPLRDLRPSGDQTRPRAVRCGFSASSCLASRELGYSPRVPKEKELNSSSFLRFHLDLRPSGDQTRPRAVRCGRVVPFRCVVER